MFCRKVQVNAQSKEPSLTSTRRTVVLQDKSKVERRSLRQAQKKAQTDDIQEYKANKPKELPEVKRSRAKSPAKRANATQAKSKETKIKAPPSAGQRNQRAVQASKRPQMDTKQPSKETSKPKEDQMDITKKQPSNLPQKQSRSPESRQENRQIISEKRKYSMKDHEIASLKDPKSSAAAAEKPIDIEQMQKTGEQLAYHKEDIVS